MGLLEATKAQKFVGGSTVAKCSNEIGCRGCDGGRAARSGVEVVSVQMQAVSAYSQEVVQV